MDGDVCKKERLFTLSYILLCVASFLTSFSFFLLVPTLPFYLTEVFDVEPHLVGVVLSCYVVAVLCVRPYAGFVADLFPRKRVYIASYIMFALAFIGYLGIKSSLAIFVVLRVFHGFAFGSLTTAANTLVIDVMPSSRRGEGLGYYGVMNNLAMAFGPMAGLFVVSSSGYTSLFVMAVVSALSGLLFAQFVKTSNRAICSAATTSVLSTDRFFLSAGIPACVALMLLAVPYGMTTSYMAMYANNIGLTTDTGLFFTIMAFGLIVSRLFSGKRVDKGYITSTIRNGMFIAFWGVLGEALLSFFADYNITVAYVIYFVSALFIGYGFGTMFPAFNTLFVNLAPNSRRATATATYLTGWDVGIGMGMLLGGALGNGGFALSFTMGALLVVLSTLFFIFYAAPHFNKNRLR